MNAHPNKHPSAGFSLIEIVIAVGIVAFAIPSVLGVMAVFSSSSSATMDRGEAASVANSLQLYLSGKVTNLPFATIYGWTYAARQNPANAQVIYAYKSDASQSDYSFSQTPPNGAIEGKLLAAEILAPDPRVLPAAALVSDNANYAKAYLPIKVAIYALSTPAQPLTPASFVDSYPMVIPK